MDELLGEFIAETLETLENLSGEVIAWEADPSDRDRLDAFFRFFHTVKGSCGFLNLPRFERLSHAAEDVLAAIRAGERVADPATISAVLAVMDRIGDLATALTNDKPPVDEMEDDPLLQSLTAAPAPALSLVPAVGDEEDEGAVIVEAGEEAPAEGTVPVVTAGQTRDRPPRTIRISLSLIDQLMNGVSDMVLARNELARRLRASGVDPDVEGSFDRLSACVAEMRDVVSKTRMQRVDRLFAAIPRMVRDLSHDLGKKVNLALEGGDVEMDREMIEMVVDPLTHIVRNALDHGIEPPIQRLAAGKAETGQLQISARQSGNQIVISIIDNGRGIDTEALTAKALRNKVATEAEVAAMTHAEKIALIFHPGLSTAKSVSAISGRGVGMDVVRNNVERIGGVVTLESALGRGTLIQLRVPMTLTIIPGLILRCGHEMFAIPRGNVTELLHQNSAMVKLDSTGGARMATIRGERYPLIELQDLLGHGGDGHDPQHTRTLMLVHSTSGLTYALAVDAVENHEELVIRPASPLVMAAGIFAGMTLPDNGRPMLLLDPAGIMQAAELPAQLTREVADTMGQPAAARTATVRPSVQALHFAELSGESRLVALDVVERIAAIPARWFGESDGAWFVRLNDRLVPVAAPVDPSADMVKTLHLKAGERELCYPVSDVIDILDMPLRPDLVLQRRGIAGIVSIEGRHYEVIDTHALFAALDAGGIAGAERGTCLVAGLADDPWMRTILAPLLVQAGYDVRDADAPDPDAAVTGGRHVLLCSDASGSEAAERLPASPVIRLRARADRSDPADASIYRYDRPALLAAIDRHLRSAVA